MACVKNAMYHTFLQTCYLNLFQLFPFYVLCALRMISFFTQGIFSFIFVESGGICRAFSYTLSFEPHNDPSLCGFWF